MINWKALKRIAYIYSIVATALLVWLHIEYREARDSGPTVITETRIDTVYIDKPQPIRQIITRIDTCYLPIVKYDTVIIRKSDTIAVAIPIEKKEYGDSTYRAIISGYRPNLDYIEIYSQTQKITAITLQPVGKSDKFTPFSVHLGAGVAATPKGLQPAVTLSIGIDLYRFKRK